MYISTAPGRVCLYGEHQDYLGLTVIPAAINLRLKLLAEKTDDDYISVWSKNINDNVKIKHHIKSLTTNNLFKSYLEAGLIAFEEHFSMNYEQGLRATVESDIPIASGLSSSAALLVAWISLLAGINNVKIGYNNVAELAYRAEHDIIGVPCGKMDQYSTAYGGIITMHCSEPPKVERIDFPESKIVIVDTQTKKLTSSVHSNVAERAKRVVKKFEKMINISIEDANIEDLEKKRNYIAEKDYKLLRAVINIKNYTQEAKIELSKQLPDMEKLGILLTLQHKELREGLQVSTEILDKVTEIGIKNGALGGKLTGAGLGGCAILLVTDKINKVIDAIRNELKLPYWITTIDEGVQFAKQ